MRYDAVWCDTDSLPLPRAAKPGQDGYGGGGRALSSATPGGRQGGGDTGTLIGCLETLLGFLETHTDDGSTRYSY